jgi:PAS domain S-box-containing protein/diguanylate cyclase (GGDEF)-like protein
MLPEDVSSAIVEHAQEGILVADVRSADSPIVYVNRAFEAITGYSREETIGKNCRYLQGSDRLQPEIDVVREALAAGEAARVRLRNYRKDGSLFWNDLHLVPVTDPAGAPTHYVGLIGDVSEGVATALRLEQMMHTDQLTGCLNRDGLVQKLSSRPPSSRVLLIKLDIERFHEINGGYGYDSGDALLRATAQRLMTLGAELVGRVGNDQFALAFAIAGDADVAEALQRLTRSLAPRFALPGADLKVRFAIGFVTGTPGADPMRLVRQAGAALADSKATPLRRPCEFAAEREAIAHNRLQMTAELQRALSADEFIYHYQPQVNLLTGKIVGAEALVRWQHPLFGLQHPGRFIALAEETGLILDIGASGLRDVARFVVGFNRDRAEPLCFSFNVSPIELTHRDMVAFVRLVLEETGADPAWLTLELTESLLAEDSPEMLSIFRGLRDLGIGLSIDDFGTGYSSLRYLERFPLTEIKIDRSFVSGLHGSAAKRVIVEAVIKLGSELGVRVVAEGVEQQTERDLLAAMGCSLAQGYLFSRPLPASEFSAVAG